MKKTKPAKPFGYSEIQNNAAMALRVEEGVPVTDLVEFGRQAGFTTDELAHLIHIPPRTYARRVAGKARFKIPEGERAVRLMRVYDTAKRLFVTHENTRQWLNSELPALGGRTPFDFARTEQGAREVEDLVGRIEDGIIS
jgi:putative toxin-antitoxin system antitoxin component (TIGR02293 family)